MAKELQNRLATPINPGGELDINDMEMARNLLSWLMFEVIVGTKNLFYKHVGLFINNTEAVSWIQRGAEKNPQLKDVCSESYICGKEWNEHHR